MRVPRFPREPRCEGDRSGQSAKVTSGTPRRRTPRRRTPRRRTTGAGRLAKSRRPVRRARRGGPQDPGHRARRARRQPPDRRRQGRRRTPRRFARAAVGGRALRGRQPERGLPARRAAPQPPPRRPAAPLRLRQGAVLLVAARGRRHLRDGRLLLLLPGRRGAQGRRRGVLRRLCGGPGGTRRRARSPRAPRCCGALHQVRRQGAPADGRSARPRPAHGDRRGRHGRARRDPRDRRAWPCTWSPGRSCGRRPPRSRSALLLVYVAYRLGRDARDQLDRGGRRLRNSAARIRALLAGAARDRQRGGPVHHARSGWTPPWWRPVSTSCPVSTARGRGGRRPHQGAPSPTSSPRPTRSSST